MNIVKRTNVSARSIFRKCTFHLERSLNSSIGVLCPGPSDGRNGALRQRILNLELTKRDCKLQRLFELEEHSPARSAWVGLGTIAYEIISHFKPKKVVELGSFGGFSTCAMALALRDLGEGGQIYAVDTWIGDDHTGLFGEQIYGSFLEKRRALGESGSTRTPIPAQGGQQSGDCGQQVMAA